MEPFILRSGFPFNYDADAASLECGLTCLDPSMTKQSFADEVDINTIVRRFNLTGQLPENVRMPTYTDFEDVFDFKSAMDAVAAAGEAFDEMPAEVRARFHNSPAEFVDFCSDVANRPEAEKLGLVLPASKVVAPAPPAAAAAVAGPVVAPVVPAVPVVPPVTGA